jgi:hypothetical protein
MLLVYFNFYFNLLGKAIADSAHENAAMSDARSIAA